MESPPKIKLESGKEKSKKLRIVRKEKAALLWETPLSKIGSLLSALHQ
ncbi:hypothetical protein Q8W15_01695 [Photobacterium damselae subsp. piscicida]|uniref:Uncharacterized protein n=1 Tax=Photobacterium damsela subsp. piscicida TaxID=38294 RepID=A0A7L8A3F5_PHODP|nr:hypothetical protein [Photobacterium damselae]MBE8130427.1 hypothetical protein [Photobacterium damselae subsp. piscicida]MDP2556409.1 hypothetical protein [Photobacterium damselae subsp. piscicida]QOD52582.1 hypothetical protein IC628_14860 [Photobacterium damselae subsp. piscicida]QOD56431.1 hypothetical protein IC627_14900 [Photobacterium damselae subsp. piscicida]